MTKRNDVASVTPTITKRIRRRRLKSGAVVVQTRFVVNFREPRSGQRKQFFFERYKDAIIKRDELLSNVTSRASLKSESDLTVAKAVEYWLQNRRTEVKVGTWYCYRQATRYIVGPLLTGSRQDRKIFTQLGRRAEGTELIEMLGPIRIAHLTTANIRQWHKTLSCQISVNTANVAKKLLQSSLALVAEDFDLRVPALPTKLGRRRMKPKKRILTSDQIALLLQAAIKDRYRGIYYAFPFMTGARPSEQLALLWRDVDLTTGIIRIRRMQERGGSIVELTKTEASAREIPIAPLLSMMLRDWLLVCPRRDGELHRVFPGFGAYHPWTGTRRNGGGPLCYQTFLIGYWRSALARIGLPYVTPHSARHAFISTMQAKGIEIGLVAKLAGHSNPAVTLRYYTQAVRGGEAAIQALEEAFSAR